MNDLERVDYNDMGPLLACRLPADDGSRLGLRRAQARPGLGLRHHDSPGGGLSWVGTPGREAS